MCMLHDDHLSRFIPRTLENLLDNLSSSLMIRNRVASVKLHCLDHLRTSEAVKQ